MVLILVFLSACAKSGGRAGGGSAPPHVVDSSPHVYTIIISDALSDGTLITGTLHQVCNFNTGLTGPNGFRDETSNESLTTGAGGIGCSDARNVTMTAENTSAIPFLVEVTVDGAALPDVTVAPGHTYTFQRGF